MSGPSRGTLVRRAVPLLKVACTAALLALLLWRYDLHAVLQRLTRLHPATVAAACGYFAVCQLLAAYRWQLILQAKNFSLPLRRLWRFYLIGTFFNTFLPTGLGGDVVKTCYLCQETRDGEESLVSVFLDRFTGLVGLGLITLVAVPFCVKELASANILAAVAASVGCLSLLLAAVWRLPRSARLSRMIDAILPRTLSVRLRRMAKALDGYRVHRGTLLATVGLSAVLQFLYCLLYQWISRELGTAIPLRYLMLFLLAVNLAAMLPISLGGLGVRDAVIAYLFGQVAVPGDQAVALSLTVYMVGVLTSLSGGLLMFRFHPATAVSSLPGRVGRVWRAAQSVPRACWLMGGGALLLMTAACFPWSQGPSDTRSFVDGSGSLVLAAEGHWTECAARTAAYTGGIVFLGVAVGLFTAGPRMTSAGWLLAALLSALGPWQAAFAPQQVADKHLLFREMNRVIDDVEANYFEQQTDWRSGQRFAADTMLATRSALQSEPAPWEAHVLAPQRWFQGFEEVLGFSHTFFAFFPRKLLAALIAAVVALLLGLHLADGRGLAGVARGAGLGCACAVAFWSCAVLPRACGEYFLNRAEDAWQRGDQSESTACLHTAATWMPELKQTWWYHAARGRAERLKDNPASVGVCLADAYDCLAAGRPDLALDDLRRAKTFQPADPAVNHLLAIGLSEAGLREFNAGQYSLAREHWEESLALSAINPTPWYGLSLFYLRTKDFDQSARCTEQLVRLHACFGYQRLTIRGQAFVAECWAAAHQGRWAEAHTMYCKSLRPDSW